MRTNTGNAPRGSGLTFEETIETAVAAAVRRELAPLLERIEALTMRLPPRLLTVAQAAAELGVHTDTVRRQVRSGELASRRVGRALRVDIDASRRAEGMP
jgi:excisionase family DNA binding protein